MAIEVRECPQCGHINDSVAKFCQECAASLDEPIKEQSAIGSGLSPNGQWVVALVGLSVLVVAGYVLGNQLFAGDDPRQTMHVSFILHAHLNGQAGQACAGSGGYSDIRAGAQATVKNSDGKIIANGALGPGQMAKGTTGFDCVFETTVSGVPKSDFYSVEVTRRGTVNYSHADLQQRGWEVTLELGDK
jgi:hypothetical protein